MRDRVVQDEVVKTFYKNITVIAHIKEIDLNTFFKVGPNQLKYSHGYRYLGLYINEHLDWSETLEHIVRNAQKALNTS